jgi:hypothetical protein
MTFCVCLYEITGALIIGKLANFSISGKQAVSDIPAIFALAVSKCETPAAGDFSLLKRNPTFGRYSEAV